MQEKYALVDAEIQRLESTYIAPTQALCQLMESRGTTAPQSGVSLAALVRRPQLDYGSLASFDPNRPDLPKTVCQEVEICIKYAGYIEKQLKQVEQFHRLESRALPPDMDYAGIQGLRIEARQKLDKIRPENIGQAARISGVSPADIAALMIWLERAKG